MLFFEARFLGFFLVVLLVHWALPGRRARLVWLLAASCYFYMSWNPWLISLILFSASVDYAIALWLPSVVSSNRRRLLLILSVGTNLSLLAFFKYTNFFLTSACTALNWFGVPWSWTELNIILPLGISFYTFETISYVVDVYRKKITPVRNALDYALYIMFFPHLIAGPIVRPREFLPQLARNRRFSWDRAQLGLQFFLLGAFKKVVIADRVQVVANAVFANPAAYASSAAWLGIFCFVAQLYCDFSGYSDMAVGTAHLLGFRLPRNFRLPYLSPNITELWRRWHITLSSWLRDYLYIPLGGNRGTRWQTCRNQLITMTLCGLWHGASWNFVLWGFYNGVLLVLHRAIAWPRCMATALFRPAAIAFTFLLFCSGMVLFRAQTLADAGTMLWRLAAPTAGIMPAHIAAALALLALLALGHLVAVAAPWGKIERKAPAFVLGAGLAAVLLATLLLQSEDASSFMYFQF